MGNYANITSTQLGIFGCVSSPFLSSFSILRRFPPSVCWCRRAAIPPSLTVPTRTGQGTGNAAAMRTCTRNAGLISGRKGLKMCIFLDDRYIHPKYDKCQHTSQVSKRSCPPSIVTNMVWCNSTRNLKITRVKISKPIRGLTVLSFKQKPRIKKYMFCEIDGKTLRWAPVLVFYNDHIQVSICNMYKHTCSFIWKDKTIIYFLDSAMKRVKMIYGSSGLTR